MASVVFALSGNVCVFVCVRKNVNVEGAEGPWRCAGAYHVGLHPLAVLGTSLVDVLAGRIGAHEADGLDGWMVADEVHRYTNTQTKTKKNIYIYFPATNIQMFPLWTVKGAQTGRKHPV